MTLAELERTPWAKEVRKKSSDLIYLMSLQHALGCNVRVIRQTEVPDVGRWAIVIVGIAWWLGCTKTKRQALALCKQMGWRVEK